MTTIQRIGMVLQVTCCELFLCLFNRNKISPGCGFYKYLTSELTNVLLWTFGLMLIPSLLKELPRGCFWRRSKPTIHLELTVHLKMKTQPVIHQRKEKMALRSETKVVS